MASLQEALKKVIREGIADPSDRSLIEEDLNDGIVPLRRFMTPGRRILIERIEYDAATNVLNAVFDGRVADRFERIEMSMNVHRRLSEVIEASQQAGLSAEQALIGAELECVRRQQWEQWVLHAPKSPRPEAQ